MKKFFISLFCLFTFFSFSLSSQKITGIGTYYADKFHGRKTSSGVKYHRDSLTCAHRTLPFGTYLKVRNLKNNKTVIVKVNDRGPFIKGRVIDLSARAARILGYIGAGMANLEITQLEKKLPIKEIEPEEVVTPDTFRIRSLIPTLAAKTARINYTHRLDTPLQMHNYIKKQFAKNSYNFFL